MSFWFGLKPGIAGFASLHIAVILTAALVAHLVGAPRLLRIALWVFLGLTTLATVYFGWHYVIDDIAGVAIAVLVGFRPPPFGRRALAPETADTAQPAPQGLSGR